MAVITVSAAGGNFNATGTWVGGVVPTSADDIVGASTSGQLTINVASTVRSMNFSAYTNTITFNANLTLGTASLTNDLGGASTNYAGTAGNLICNVASTFVQNNTNRIPGLQFGAGTKTLNTNLYCGRFVITSQLSVNGNTIFTNGNVGQLTRTDFTGTYMGGSSNITLDGGGLVSFSYAGTGIMTINTSGQYNTIGAGLFVGDLVTIGNTPTFNFLSGQTPTLFNTILGRGVTTPVSSRINCNILVPHNVFINNIVLSPSLPELTIASPSGITCNLFATYNNPRFYTSDTALPDIRISGGTLSAQTLNLSSTYRATSSATDPPPAGSLTYRSINLRLDPNFTHYFDKMELSGGGIPDRPAIRSTTSSAVNVVLGDRETSQITDYDFYNVNASGGEQIVAINGSISGTTNVTTTYPSGGGGGGSFTFVN